MMKRLAVICEHAYISLATGLFMLSTAIVEIFRTVEEAGIGAHHGVAVFAVLHILKAIPQIAKSKEQISTLRR